MCLMQKLSSKAGSTQAALHGRGNSPGAANNITQQKQHLRVRLTSYTNPGPMRSTFCHDFTPTAYSVAADAESPQFH
jgi:hypothetical protein